MTPGMHIAHGWAELGFVDHAEQFTAEPVKTQTDFKHDCLCHMITLEDGGKAWARAPQCEQPGHGCHYRYVSELATPSADPIRLGSHTHSSKELA